MLQPGASATYRLVITGGAAVVGGLGVSVDDPDASLESSSESLRVVDGTQLVHNAPVPFTDGTLALEFALTAPSRAGTLTIYAAGNSCDGDGTKLGDQAATTSLEIDVPAAMMPTPRNTNSTAPMPTPMQTGCSFAGTSGAGPSWLAVISLALLARRRRPVMGTSSRCAPR
jgi:MYXO-CTERM domain-containing protein